MSIISQTKEFVKYRSEIKSFEIANERFVGLIQPGLIRGFDQFIEIGERLSFELKHTTGIKKFDKQGDESQYQTGVVFTKQGSILHFDLPDNVSTGSGFGQIALLDGSNGPAGSIDISDPDSISKVPLYWAVGIAHIYTESENGQPCEVVISNPYLTEEEAISDIKSQNNLTVLIGIMVYRPITPGATINIGSYPRNFQWVPKRSGGIGGSDFITREEFNSLLPEDIMRIYSFQEITGTKVFNFDALYTKTKQDTNYIVDVAKTLSNFTICDQVSEDVPGKLGFWGIVKITFPNTGAKLSYAVHISNNKGDYAKGILTINRSGNDYSASLTVESYNNIALLNNCKVFQGSGQQSNIFDFGIDFGSGTTTDYKIYRCDLVPLNPDDESYLLYPLNSIIDLPQTTDVLSIYNYHNNPIINSQLIGIFNSGDGFNLINMLEVPESSFSCNQDFLCKFNLIPVQASQGGISNPINTISIEFILSIPDNGNFTRDDPKVYIKYPNSATNFNLMYTYTVGLNKKYLNLYIKVNESYRGDGHTYSYITVASFQIIPLTDDAKSSLYKLKTPAYLDKISNIEATIINPYIEEPLNLPEAFKEAYLIGSGSDSGKANISKYLLGKDNYEVLGIKKELIYAQKAYTPSGGDPNLVGWRLECNNDGGDEFVFTDNQGAKTFKLPCFKFVNNRKLYLKLYLGFVKYTYNDSVTEKQISIFKQLDYRQGNNSISGYLDINIWDYLEYEDKYISKNNPDPLILGFLYRYE